MLRRIPSGVTDASHSRSILPDPASPAELLRRSLENGRLGHAYLFTGENLADLEDQATLFLRRLLVAGDPLDLPPRLPQSRRIDQRQHPDVLWVKPESKSRQIEVERIRELIRNLNLRPSEAPYKVAVVISADRMNEKSANAFLKTLEEPPMGSLILLLSTEPDHLLETILSRCLRLNFGSGSPRLPPEVAGWVSEFARMTVSSKGSILERYRLLRNLMGILESLQDDISRQLKAASPLSQYPDPTPDQKEQWEKELLAAVGAEYRKRRGEFLAGLHAWLRDVWLLKVDTNPSLLALPSERPTAEALAGRLRTDQARDNLERWNRTQQLLQSNVQEALAIEVGLLQLHL
jgi:DNA polymerase-3 subunit delta'